MNSVHLALCNCIFLLFITSFALNCHLFVVLLFLCAVSLSALKGAFKLNAFFFFFYLLLLLYIPFLLGSNL